MTWQDTTALQVENMFGFPNNIDAMQVLNFCTIKAKYYIYTFNVYLKIIPWICRPV